MKEMVNDLKKTELNIQLKKARQILSKKNLLNLVEKLKEKNIKLGIAESLTGGMIASKIVDIPGTSSVFFEGIVSYSVDCKIDRLSVKKETVEEYTVVSEQVALEMAKGLLRDSYVNTAVSTTGIAGPTRDNDFQPVGLTYICVSDEDKSKVEGFIFPGNRNQVRLQASAKAIEMLNEFIDKK